MSVIFDQLRISDDGKQLYVDAHVNQAHYFDDVYIRKITICTEDQVSEINPKAYGSDFVYQKEITPTVYEHPTLSGESGTDLIRELHLVLTPFMFNEKFKATDFSHNIFFVYIDCVGVPAPDTPCTLDELTTLGITFDYGIIFNKGMQYTRELADTCSVPRNFINFILNVEALKLSLNTDHYIPAIQYWKYIMELGTGITSNTPCNCHH